jgi:methylglutaconyl-CoA hydratase
VTYRHLAIRHDAAVAHVTLNRPEARNALNAELIGELADWAAGAVESFRRGDLRAAVLAGAGPIFCAGADARWMAATIGYSEAENLRDARALAAMFEALDSVPVPLIARIQGAALGGGAGLAAVSDVVVAEESALFGFTEVKLGIVPATISPFVLAKIGRSAARELFLTGARFSAARARDIGLAHRVVGAEALDAAVAECVRDVLSAAPGAVASAKALIREVWGRNPAEACAITAAAIAKARVSPEGQEGLRAFIEKRMPHWVDHTFTTKDTKGTER